MPRTGTSRAAVALTVLLLLVACLAAAVRSSTGPVPAGTRSAASTVLYRESFADDVAGGVPSDWEMEGGTWRGMASGTGAHVLAHVEGPSAGGTIVAGSASWADYEIGADVKPSASRDGEVGVVGRYQTEGDYYECAIHHAYSVQLWRDRGGHEMELGGRMTTIDTTRFHRLTLSMHGGRITCAMDGRVAASVVDRSLRVGRFGLTAGDDEAAEFRDVVVTGD
jgi:hypothetical protein